MTTINESFLYHNTRNNSTKTITAETIIIIQTRDDQSILGNGKLYRAIKNERNSYILKTTRHEIVECRMIVVFITQFLVLFVDRSDTKPNDL